MKNIKVLSVLVLGLLASGMSSCGSTSEPEGEKNPIVPEHEHSFNEKYSYNESKHWKACSESACNEKTGEEQHKFIDVIDKIATPSSNGLKHKMCSDCHFGLAEEEFTFTNELTNIKLVYCTDGAKIVAQELQEAIKDKYSTLVPIEHSSVKQSYALNIGFDALVAENKYKVEVNHDSVNLYANDEYGLYEAARYALNNLDETEVNKNYVLVTNNYEKPEQFSIMSYNVRKQDDTDSTFPDGVSSNVVSKRLPRVVKNILTYLPDSFGVQEASVKKPSNADTGWITGLEAQLFPKYGYVGFGRSSALEDECSGIFYNRDKLILLESDTRWYSENPTQAGTKYSKFTKSSDSAVYTKNLGYEDGWNRLFTYAIFQRISDGKVYMHINSHYDLSASANLQNAIDELLFAKGYSEKMPVFLTADYNATKSENYMDWESTNQKDA